MCRYKKAGTLVGSLLVDVAEELPEDPAQARCSTFTVASARSSSHTNRTPCVWNDQAASGDWDSLKSPVPEPALEFGVLSGSRALDKKPQGLRIDATAAAE